MHTEELHLCKEARRIARPCDVIGCPHPAAWVNSQGQNSPATADECLCDSHFEDLQASLPCRARNYRSLFSQRVA